jgi:hypothetical protein
MKLVNFCIERVKGALFFTSLFHTTYGQKFHDPNYMMTARWNIWFLKQFRINWIIGWRVENVSLYHVLGVTKKCRDAVLKIYFIFSGFVIHRRKQG